MIVSLRSIKLGLIYLRWNKQLKSPKPPCVWQGILAASQWQGLKYSSIIDRKHRIFAIYSRDIIHLALWASVHSLNNRWWITCAAVSHTTGKKTSRRSVVDKAFLFSFILSLLLLSRFPPAALTPPLCVNAINPHSLIESVCASSRIQILGSSFGKLIDCYQISGQWPKWPDSSRKQVRKVEKWTPVSLVCWLAK